MPVITNNLETAEDIEHYKKWMSTKGINSLKRIKKMIELDEKFKLKKWKNVNLRIELLEKEIESRK